jgi:hypothetical protein
MILRREGNMMSEELINTEVYTEEEYSQKEQHSYSHTPKSQSQIFFQVSKMKLIVLSVFTFGIYELYWFYKNWKFLKETQDLKIEPFWRTFFAPFFCYSLFKRIQEYAKKNNVRAEYSPGWLTAGYIILGMAWIMHNPFWHISYLTVLTFLPARSVIDALNAKSTSTIKNDQFSGWNIIALVFGVILWGLSIWGMNLPDDDTSNITISDKSKPNLSYNDTSNVASIEKLEPKEIFNKNNESVVLIRVYDENGNVVSFGSGVCVHPNGIIITNFHVLNSDSFYFDIKFQKHGVFEDAYVSGISPILEDYIVLRVDGKNLPSVNFSPRNEYEIGERIVTIGNPQGLLNSLSEGVVSGRRFDGDYELYQMTAPISRGSSGGAVFDEHGYLVGISTAIVEEGQNLNFFLPVYRVNNAEVFDTALTIVQFNSLCESRAKEYKKTGDQYLLSKGYEEAIKSYKHAIELKPEYANTYYNLGVAQGKLGLYENAIKSYKHAIELNPDDANTYNNLGVVQEKLGLNEDAIESYKRAIKLNPN